MRQIALIGNPNCGKTTLLNALTGANLRVGNWPGVTVERKQAELQLPGSRAMLNDLPGVYSLSPYSVEERLAVEYLLSGEPDVILLVLDATNLERNLYLALELRSLGIPAVAALNLMDVLRSGGGHVDVRALSNCLGMPVIAVSAAKRQGLGALREALARIQEKPTCKRPVSSKNEPKFVDFLAHAAAQYGRIGAMLKKAGYLPPVQQQQQALDRLILHPALAYPVFFALMAALFFVTFGPIGALLTHWCEQAVALAAVALRDGMVLLGAAPALRSLVLDGALAGLGGVLCFLPQILLLFALLSLLEDSGYMARAAYLFDRPLRALGLSGRAFIPMLMGFGCTTTAVVSARGVDDERDRRMTILLLPFMSCSAKLPVYALFGAALFAGRQSLLVLSLYLLGMLVMALVGWMLSRTKLGAMGAPFVLELPPYRWPQPASVARRVGERAKHFLVRAGTLIFLMSMLIWALQSFTPAFQWAQTAEQSLFGRLGQLIAPLFAPVGFGEWRKCVALLCGLVAKEAVVSTLTVLYGAADSQSLAAALRWSFTPASAAAYLVFTLLYPPCLSALAAMRRELGSRSLTALSIGIQLSAAWLAALVVYQLGRMMGG